MHLHIQAVDRKTDFFDAKPAAVQQWVSTLPVTNIGQTARMLYQALQATNAQEMPAKQRFQVLELLRPRVFYVLDSLKKHILGQTFPLNEKAGKVALLTQELLRELASGYKVIIMFLVAEPPSMLDGRILTTAIHRTLHCLSMQLLRAYQVYSPYPEHSWADIHQLYEYAESHDLAQTQVADEKEIRQTRVSIDNLYKEILLLALACPFRMRQGEVELIHEKIQQWAPHSSLKPLVLPGQPNGLFVVNLGSDDPPTYLSLHHRGIQDTRCRALNTADLTEDVRQALAESSRQEKATSILNENTLRRLMLAWGVMPKRRFSRTQQTASVSVTMGLAATHYFVSGEAVFNHAGSAQENTPFQNHPQFNADVVSSEKGQTPELWELEPTNLENSNIKTGTPPAQRVQIPTGVEPEDSSPFRYREWKMVNVSAGGYCLLWDSLENSRAIVGELVGIREHSDQDTFHWRLGVIRWMKCESGLELGVQMLSPGAVAVGARPYPATTTDHRFQRSLLLPEIHSIAQPATLVLASPPFRVGGSAIIHSNGREIRVKLEKLVENTGTFAQFQFRTMEGSKSEEPEKSSFPQGADFEELWDSI